MSLTIEPHTATETIAMSLTIEPHDTRIKTGATTCTC